MKPALKTAIALFTTLTLLACGESSKLDPRTPKEPRVLEKPKLTQINSCEDFVESIKKVKLEWISAQLGYYQSCPEYSSYYNNPIADYAPSSAGTSSTQPTADAAETGPTFTDTNSQESNVAEADIIKTNGKYIFVATSKGVDIFRAWPLAEFGKIGQFEVEGGVSHLLLSGTTLIAVSNQYQEIFSSSANVLMAQTAMGDSAQLPSRISLIDITQAESPELLWEETLPGSIINARLIRDILHVATKIYLRTPSSLEIDFKPLYTEYESTNCQDENLAKISNTMLEDAKQQMENLTEQDVFPEGIACDEIMTDGTNLKAADELNFAGLTSLNIQDPSQFKQSFVHGLSHELYVTERSVYVVGSDYGNDRTDIHRFALDAETLHDYKTSTAVEGQFMGSFSFSEHENTLRVAVYGMAEEIGMMTGAPTETRVLTLDITEDGLPELGRLTGLGKGEFLYGVRFFGNRGYVVTYKKVDPLYVLDLSDPKNPKVEGELKMPGFSTYLHWLDENHIIGLGKDAEEVSGKNFSWFQGLKLATFDVGSAQKPVVADELVIGGRGTTSYALNDHHAFTFDASSGTLALPLTFYEKSKGSNNYGKKLYEGVHVYQIDATNGISEQAIVTLPQSATAPKRTIMVGDEAENGLFVLDNMNLYLFDATNGYEFVTGEKLDHEIYWYGWCGTI